MKAIAIAIFISTSLILGYTVLKEVEKQMIYIERNIQN